MTKEQILQLQQDNLQEFEYRLEKLKIEIEMTKRIINELKNNIKVLTK